MHFLDPARWPPIGDPEWLSHGTSDLIPLVKEWEEYLQKVLGWTDPLDRIQAEFYESKKHLLKEGLYQPKAAPLEFWRPIILRQDLFPKMHVILRMALALNVSSSSCERFFSLLNRLNRQDRRRLRMDRLEQLALVAWDAKNWAEYDFTPILLQYRSVRRARAERKDRADKGKARRRDPSAPTPPDDPEPSDDSDGGDGASVASVQEGPSRNQVAAVKGVLEGVVRGGGALSHEWSLKQLLLPPPQSLRSFFFTFSLLCTFLLFVAEAHPDGDRSPSLARSDMSIGSA
jgi:hypothetical protein